MADEFRGDDLFSMEQGESGAPASPPLKHPVATGFHVGWKILALLCYYLGGKVFDNFILVFIFCILFFAFDFWTVKNVTGRLLVGLRWWNEVREDGTTHWVFESAPDDQRVHPMEKRVFWGGMVAQVALWLLIGAYALLTLQVTWLPVIAVGVGLGGSNLWGYVKCQRDAKEQVGALAMRVGGARLLDAAWRVGAASAASSSSAPTASAAR